MPKRVLLSETKKRHVREAWLGPLTREAIARRHSISEKLVRNIWDEAIEAGLLPADTPRPHFVKRCKSTDDDAEVIVDDGSPIGDPNPTFVHECNWSLAALRAAHPERNSVASQTAPREWLAWDHRRHFGEPIAPTRAELMAMCREADAGKAVAA